MSLAHRTNTSHESDRASHHMFGSMMEQLCLDLEDCLVPTGLHLAQATIQEFISTIDSTDTDTDVDTDVDFISNEQHFSQHSSLLFSDSLEALQENHDKYIHFALDMFLTCAEDISDANKILAQQDVQDVSLKKIQQAQDLKNNTILWLRGEVESLFSFDNCVELLEQELLIQSNGQVNVPDIMDKKEHLSQWIINDPESAKEMLKKYKTIFYARDVEDMDEYNDSSTNKPARYRTVQ